MPGVRERCPVADTDAFGSLEQPTVDKNPLSTRIHEVPGPRHGVGSPQEAGASDSGHWTLVATWPFLKNESGAGRAPSLPVELRTEGIGMNATTASEHGVAFPNTGIRVFILDDHELVRRGLQDLLESEGFVVVGMSGSAAEAARRIPALQPDVAILDARLPDGTGIEVCRDVHSVDETINCLILTSYDDEQALRGAVLAGASGYVLKEIGGSDLIGALRRAARGESLFDADLKARIIQGLAEPKRVDPRVASLTRQERRVLELVGEGLTNRQIGERMLLAEKTVKNYVSSLLAKLGFERRTQAAVHMAQHSSPDQ